MFDGGLTSLAVDNKEVGIPKIEVLTAIGLWMFSKGHGRWASRSVWFLIGSNGVVFKTMQHVEKRLC